MKFLSAIFLLSISLNQPVWFTNFDTAKTEAATSNKLIVLNFSGSDWCGPCIRMKKEILSSDVFTIYAAEKLVLVNADFPRYKINKLSKSQENENEKLADKYNSSGKFPLTVLLNADGKVLKEWEGFPDESPGKFTEEIKTFEHAVN